MSKLITLGQLKTCVESLKSFASGLVSTLRGEVLTKSNTTSYTPTSDYHPSTKKYVDDSVSTANTHASKSAASADGAHDLRYYNGVLQYNDNGTWKTLSISDFII